MHNPPFSARLYELKQRLARIVVEHEPECLSPHVDREIEAFLADVPPSEARRFGFAVDAMLQRMMLPGSRIRGPVPGGDRGRLDVRMRAPSGGDAEAAPDGPHRQIRNTRPASRAQGPGARGQISRAGAGQVRKLRGDGPRNRSPRAGARPFGGADGQPPDEAIQ